MSVLRQTTLRGLTIMSHSFASISQLCIMKANWTLYLDEIRMVGKSQPLVRRKGIRNNDSALATHQFTMLQFLLSLYTTHVSTSLPITEYIIVLASFGWVMISIVSSHCEILWYLGRALDIDLMWRWTESRCSINVCPWQKRWQGLKDVMKWCL